MQAYSLDYTSFTNRGRRPTAGTRVQPIILPRPLPPQNRQKTGKNTIRRGSGPCAGKKPSI